MEVGRSSTVLLLLAVAALMLDDSSTTAAAAVHRRQPSTNRSYQLITVETTRGDKAKLAMRADDSAIAGFANEKNEWFAIQGIEDLMEPLRNKYGGGGYDIPGHGLVNLLGAMLKKNATS